jgi:phosphatidylglycerophosphate synthase
MANALTSLRLLLIFPFVFVMAKEGGHSAPIAAAIIFVAIATDLVDGPIARSRGTVTPQSGAFDHAVDFVFVDSALFAGAYRGVFPWILPILVAAAFTQYWVDSRWRRPQAGLRKSKLGRYNGILYFAPPCVDILIRLGLQFLRPALIVLVWGLVLSTVVSMGQRLWFSRSRVQLTGSPAQK